MSRKSHDLARIVDGSGVADVPAEHAEIGDPVFLCARDSSEHDDCEEASENCWAFHGELSLLPGRDLELREASGCPRPCRGIFCLRDREVNRQKFA